MFILRPFEDEHGGVDRHADGEHEAGDARKGERRPDRQQPGIGQQPVDEQRDRGQQPEEPVVGDHVEDRQRRAEQCGDDAGAHGRLSQRGPDRPLLDDLDRHGQGSGPDQQRQVLRLALGELAGDDRLASGDPLAAPDVSTHLGARDHLAVEHDRHPPGRITVRRAGGPARQLGPLAPSAPTEVDLHLPAGTDVGPEQGAGRADGVAGQGWGPQPEALAVLALEHLAGRPFGWGRGALDGQHWAELELCRPPDDLDRLVGIGDTGQLDDDPLRARTLQRRLGDTERVDSPSQHLQGAGHHITVDLDRVGVASLQDDLGPSLKVKTQPDRLGEGERDCARHGHEDGEQAPPRGIRHLGFLPDLPAGSRLRSSRRRAGGGAGRDR